MLIPQPATPNMARLQTTPYARRWVSRIAALATALLFAVPSVGNAESGSEASPSIKTSDIAARLKAAYPGIVTAVTDNLVTFADGTTLPLDDGKEKPTLQTWLDTPDIADMFAKPYPWGAPLAPPAVDFDPGRARNADFFVKVYGNCHNGEVARDLVTVVWLPRKFNRHIRVTRRNRAAEAFAAVSRELDALPSAFDTYLAQFGGTYVCRPIAGTRHTSAHAYGIAIDIAPKKAAYWRWTADGKMRPYSNAMPTEIIAIFEKHGFIWGGRWYHYDTMHFEYRPELSPAPGLH